MSHCLALPGAEFCQPEAAMSQHFLPTVEARSLSARGVSALSEEEAIELFRELRWGNGDEVVFPDCGVVERH